MNVITRLIWKLGTVIKSPVQHEVCENIDSPNDKQRLRVPFLMYTKTNDRSTIAHIDSDCASVDFLLQSTNLHFPFIN